MASGDIKQFGMWKCISSNAVSYKTGGYWPYSIYYSEYSNGVTLVDYDSSKCSDDPIEWIEYSYNGKTVYIQNKLFFYSISIAESLRMCSNNIYVDGVKYKLSFMPKEFWTNLPSSICTLFKTDTSKKFYTNSPFYTDSTSYYYSVYFDGNSFSYDSESIGENTVDETYAFVPVLVQDNSFNDGNTVRFGRWITNSGDYIYDNYSEIDLSYYKSVQLDPDYTDSNALTWVEGQVDGHKCYFAKPLLINYISHNKARQLCNNTYTINGNEYKLTLLTRSQWKSLPFSVYSNLQYPTLYGDDGLQEYIFTSETRHPNVYGAYRTLSDQAFSTRLIPDDIISDYDTVSGYVYFAPVLVSSNDVPDGTVVKIGAITLDGTLQTQQKSNEHINQYYSTNTMPKVSLVDTSNESEKWSWLKFTDGGIKKYICTSGIFLGCSYAGLIKSIKTVKIENTIYELRFPTYDEFVALAKANFLGKINNYMDNGHDSSYHVITSSGGCASFLVHSQNISSQIDSLDFTSYADGDFDEHRLVIPILVERNVPDGTIVEMGMTYDFNNGYDHTASMETIYPVDGFTRVYDISEDVNIVRTLEIVDYNSSYTDEPPMDWVAYNYQNKLYYISRTTFIWGNISDTFDICNNNKTIFLNGDYYKMTTMPIEFWTNLPSSVKNNMEITNLRMHTNSEVQVSIPNKGMQTGYRTVSFDTEAIKFVEDIPVVSGMQGEGGCAFIPVLTRIDIGPVKTVKMGILTDHEYRLPRKASKDNDWYLSSNTYRTNYEGCGFRFSSATQYEKDHDMEWEWIEITIDGTRMYISTTVSFLSYPVSHYYYDMEKYACIDGKFYLLKILTVQQWKSLPNSVLSKIDWKSSSGNYNLSTITSTEASSGGRHYANYNPSTKEWNTYGTYEITSESYIPELGCIPVLQPITSGMVKMSTLITPESPWPIHFSDATSSRNYIFYDTVIDNTSYNPIGKWITTALNGKTILINTETIPDFNSADANSYNNKIVYFDGNKFKIRLLSKNEWESVPTNALNQISLFDGGHYVYTSTIENNLITCLNYNRNTGSFSYRTAELSTNTNPYELLFILEYIGPGPDNIKLGALVNSSGNIVAPKICSDQDFRYPDGSVSADEGLSNFSFTDTDNENLKWTWIKTQINGNTVLISKYVTGPCRYDTISEVGLIGKTFVLENDEYQLIFLTPSEIDTLDYATLYNIDFGYGNSASWHMFTNSVSGNTIKSFSFCNDNAFGDLISEYYTEETDTNYGRSGYYATLKLISTPPTISGSDSNLGDKTQTFSVN